MIILARHGQTEWNKVKRVQGWQNSPLTELGKRQAFDVAKELRQQVGSRAVNIVTSPLGRAFTTAKIIAAELGKSESDLKSDILLQEYSFGDWAGMTFAQVKHNHFEQWQSRETDKWNYVIPGGESYAIVADRAEKWLASLPADGITIAVSHEMIARCIRGSYLGLDEQQTMSNTQKNNQIVLLEGGRETLVTV